MENVGLYPLQFQPIYKDYVWGGRKIAQHYQRKLLSGVYAESWEIADRLEGMSVVTNGPLAGRDLFGLMKNYGEKIVGRQSAEFPLLVKIIDAKEKLSVQVHPDTNSAREIGGDPKTEMWYVLAAEKGAEVYAGIQPGVTPAVFKEALSKGRVGELLRVIPVARGDVIYIPGGRIHAIGAGCMLLEIMQNSDTTFRLYDWNRPGKNGQPRALQVNKALKAIRWNDTDNARILAANKPLQFDREGNAAAELLTTPFFKFEKMVVAAPAKCSTGGKTFHILFVEEGAAELKSGSNQMRLEHGTTTLIPAALSDYTLAPSGKPADILRISLP